MMVEVIVYAYATGCSAAQDRPQVREDLALDAVQQRSNLCPQLGLGVAMWS
jgi:hypothetical protein